MVTIVALDVVVVLLLLLLGRRRVTRSVVASVPVPCRLLSLRTTGGEGTHKAQLAGGDNESN